MRCGHANWAAVLAIGKTPFDPLRRLVRDLWNAGGTDLHVEPQGIGARVLFRIHGSRRIIETLSSQEYHALKMAVVPNMKHWDDALPTDGSVDVEIDGERRTFPIASFPANDGHKFVVRMSDRRVDALRLEELGIQDLDAWLSICRSGPGLVIVSGTTCQGKSTTIRRTVDRLASEGIDAIMEEQNGVFHEGRVREMIDAARTRTVILEGYGSSLDRAIANAMVFGLDNGDLTKVFRGGMHQRLHRQRVGPMSLETMTLPRS